MTRSIISTVSTGNLPIAVSLLSMTASVPSKMALATSVTSARVGDGFSTMELSICVAVMTGLPMRLHRAMSLFWIMGTSSIGISTPRSPRATMIPFAMARMLSMFWTACHFSTLTMMGTCAPCVSISRAELTNIVGCAHEREGHVVDSSPQARQQIMSVLIRDCRDMEVRLGKVDSLVVREGSTLQDFCDDSVALDLTCLETNQSVINEDKFSGTYLGCQARIVHTGLLGVAIYHPGRQTEDISGHDLTWPLSERAQADLWPLQVLQNGQWKVEITADLLYGSYRAKAFCVRAM